MNSASPTATATEASVSTAIGRMASARVIGHGQGSETRQVGAVDLASDERAHAGWAAGLDGERGGEPLVVQVEVERVPPRAWVGARQAPQDAGCSGVQQDSRHAVPETHRVTLGDVVEQGRAEQVRVVVAALEDLLRDVEGVTTIGDRHGIEETHRCFRQEPLNEGRLLRLDAGSNVGDELSDPMHRSAPV